VTGLYLTGAALNESPSLEGFELENARCAANAVLISPYRLYRESEGARSKMNWKSTLSANV